MLPLLGVCPPRECASLNRLLLERKLQEPNVGEPMSCMSVWSSRAIVHTRNVFTSSNLQLVRDNILTSAATLSGKMNPSPP